MGFQRKISNVEQSSHTLDISTADAIYENAGNKVTITITDGAGETGSSILSILMIALQCDFEKKTENGIEKTDYLNGKKAILKEEKNFEKKQITKSSIQYIARNRYAVSLSSEILKLDELKKFNQHLKLDQLP